MPRNHDGRLPGRVIHVATRWAAVASQDGGGKGSSVEPHGPDNRHARILACSHPVAFGSNVDQIPQWKGAFHD